MHLLNYAVNDCILIDTPHMLFTEVFIYIGQQGECVSIEDEFTQLMCSLDKCRCY